MNASLAAFYVMRQRHCVEKTCAGRSLATPLYLKVLPRGARLRQVKGSAEQSSPPVDRRLYALLIWIFALGATAVSLLLYGLGNGLRAIVRGLLPLVLMPASQYVALMGRMSRPSLIGQALKPLVGGYLMQHFGATGVLVTLCSLAMINVVLVGLVLRSLQRSPAHQP